MKNAGARRGDPHPSAALPMSFPGEPSAERRQCWATVPQLRLQLPGAQWAFVGSRKRVGERRGACVRGARVRGARGAQRGAASQAPSPRAALVYDTEGSWGGGTQNDAARGSPVSALPGTPPPLRAATVPPPPAGPGEGPAPFRNEAARPAELGSGSGVWAPKPALCRAAHQLPVGVACRSLPSRSRSPTLCWPTTMQTCGGWFSWGRGDFAPQGGCWRCLENLGGVRERVS